VCERGAGGGANYAFAPVIDIDYNFRNPITNTRTYGSDPDFVREAGVAYVKTVQEMGMAASIKHFPGDGVDERDQHLVTSINTLTCEQWDNTYGKVYKASIDAGALTVMAAHIMLPSFSKQLNPFLKDEDIMPATLAPELLNGLLREKLGFNGMIITDASTMAGMCIPMRRDNAVPYSIAAGCDMFLFTRNLQEDYEFMRQGVARGIITAERLDEAVLRILATKAALGLHEKQRTGKLIPDIENARTIIGCAEHKEIEKECIDKGITLVKNEEAVLPVTPDKYKRILLYSITSEKSFFFGEGGADIGSDMKEALEAEGFEIDIYNPSQGFEGFTTAYSDITDKYDLIVYVSNLMTKSNQTTVRIEWQMPMGANCPIYISAVPTIFISFANPYHLIDVPRIKTFINAYKYKKETLDAVVDKLLGRSEFKGISPVDAFCGLWDTRL
jgi:beta-N-acetylhexosaminidase